MILRKYTVEIWEMTNPISMTMSDIHYGFTEEEAMLAFRATLSRQMLSKWKFPLIFKAKEIGENNGESRDKWGQKAK